MAMRRNSEWTLQLRAALPTSWRRHSGVKFKQPHTLDVVVICAQSHNGGERTDLFVMDRDVFLMRRVVSARVLVSRPGRADHRQRVFFALLERMVRVSTGTNKDERPSREQFTTDAAFRAVPDVRDLIGRFPLVCCSGQPMLVPLHSLPLRDRFVSVPSFTPAFSFGSEYYFLSCTWVFVWGQYY